jgi:hypothetical protein
MLFPYQSQEVGICRISSGETHSWTTNVVFHNKTRLWCQLTYFSSYLSPVPCPETLYSSFRDRKGHMGQGCAGSSTLLGNMRGSTLSFWIIIKPIIDYIIILCWYSINVIKWNGGSEVNAETLYTLYANFPTIEYQLNTFPLARGQPSLLRSS